MTSDEELDAVARETVLRLTAMLIGLDEITVQARDGAMLGLSSGDVTRLNRDREARRRRRFLEETKQRRRNLD